ncbi:MAG: CopG family ribbon-helix-helix protein [Variibacter sp.]|nr:CopG family ribbon-helix-helix protein [Variibacter sp.]
MSSTTVTLRVNQSVKERLERLAKSTGRSRSYLAAEALSAYLDVNEWQIAGIKRAAASLDQGQGVPHAHVKDWVASWKDRKERPQPKAIPGKVRSGFPSGIATEQPDRAVRRFRETVKRSKRSKA